jgi:hypothetical protein
MSFRRVTAVLASLVLTAAAAGAGDPPVVPAPAPSVEEAGARARLLHASFRGALEVMHRDFFRKGESKAIPSESLQDVFTAMAAGFGVSVRWLASEETVMNVDHKARDAFGERALKALASGAKELLVVEDGRLRYAGAIVLHNQCLKCHVANRTSLEDRLAAIEITMPVKPAAPPSTP